MIAGGRREEEERSGRYDVVVGGSECMWCMLRTSADHIVASQIMGPLLLLVVLLAGGRVP